jgi:hypothetical protein
VPVTDLQVKHGDLVASTEGRAFWILDDLSVLRQHADSLATVAAHLYAPRPAVMAAGGGGFGAPAAEGRNPPAGATLFVRLAATPDSATTVTLEIRDAAGAVVRSFASRGDSLNPLRLKAGLNPVNWNLRRAAPTRLPNVMLFGAPGDGPMVLAGRYTVRLTWKGGAATVVREQPLEVRPDPRQGAVPAAVLAERDSLARLLAGRVDEIHKAVLQVRDLRTQVQGYVTRAGGTAAADTVAKAGRALAAKLQGLDPRLTTKAGNGQDIINYANGINGQYGFLWGQVEGNDGVISSVRERLVELEVKWRELRTEVERVTGAEVEAFNALLKANGVPGVIGAKKGPIA